MRKPTRRGFVIGAVGTALAGAASPVKVYAEAARPRLVTRRAVGTMQPNDPIITSYRLAVERMKALPETDPRSWNRQTQIHVDFCPHGNWYFLPWHRAYLVAFERICRQMSGNENFALPFWDWTEQRQLPAAFTVPTVNGRPNALIDTTREMAPTATLTDATVGPNVISRIFAETNFELFGSSRPTGQDNTAARWLQEQGRSTQLESGPHNNTHVTIGGNMSDMVSPQDPIFWLHHCNIDRIWARWIASGRNNSTDPLWTNFPFSGMFVTPQVGGTQAYNVSVSDVLDQEALGYTYPDLPSGTQVVAAAGPAELRLLASQRANGVAKLNAPLSTLLSLAPIVNRGRPNERTAPPPPPNRAPAGGAIDPNDFLRESPMLASPGNAPAADQDPGPASDPGADIERGRVFLVIQNVSAMRGRAARVNAFLNCPYLRPDTPESDPHFVGTFGAFGLQSHARHGGFNVQVELTDTIARLRRQNRNFGGQLDVQLMPVRAVGDLELRLERIDIARL